MFITFEGGDGAGKTTLINSIKNWFESLHIPVLSTREPDGNLRDLIKGNTWDKTTELLLFAADRAHHVNSVIKPALELGTVVLCDRYTHSTLAYQGAGRGMDINKINWLNEMSTNGLNPDLVVWLNVSPQVAESRRFGDTNSRGKLDNIDLESIEFHTRVYECYKEMTKTNPSLFIVLNAEQDPTDVYTELIQDEKWVQTTKNFHL